MNKLQLPTEDLRIGLLSYNSGCRDINASLTSRIKIKENDFIVEETLKKYGLTNHSKWVLLKIIKPYGIDTMTLKKTLLKKIPSSSIHIYGLKDRYSIATQYMVANKKYLKIIANELKKFKISINELGFIEDPLTFKENISGNKFNLIVYNPPKEYYLKYMVYHIQKTGLPNYFGYQRFGIHRLNHIVGKVILIGPDYLDTLPSLLYEELNKVIKLDLIRDRQLLHRKRYRYLIRYFLDSYQSYLFNKALGLRLLSNKQTFSNDFCLKYLGDGHHIITKCNNLRSYELKQNLLVPLIGYDYLRMSSKDGFREIYRKILEEESISIDHFKTLYKMGILMRGGFRRAFITNCKIKYRYINNKKLRLIFELDKGTYATIILREIIKPLNPRNQGF